MIRWIPYTFLRITGFFIGGILLAVYFPGILSEGFALTLVFILCGCYLICFFVRSVFEFSFSVLSFFAFPAIFLAGYLHLFYQTDTQQADHLSNQSGTIKSYRVTIGGYPEEKDRSWKMTGEIDFISSDGWKKTSGKVLLYFRKSDFPQPYRYGDVLLVKGSPKNVSPPGNPGEFDYKRFLSFRNIFHQQFLSADDVILIASEPPNQLKYYAIEIRSWANKVIHQYVEGENEQAIAAALILGITDGLDNDLLKAYAATGAMHVLAVSGLHISIIYLIILFFLKPLNKTRSGKWIVALISLFILWAYAFVTGLSPSVLRAVMMFSFVAVANATSRNTNIYNTLAASAFCLLLYDPYLIMSVGFQLSYLAVLGIVYLQPLLYDLWQPRTWLVDQSWKIICVSIAAQLATFSLGMLYFHQFPNYFLLSNLLVIPVSFAVLILGLVLLAVSFSAMLATIAGLVLKYSIIVMNFFVVAVEWFPFSLVEGIYIDTLQCWLLMLAIVSLILLIRYKKFKYIYPAFVFLLMFTVIQWIHYTENRASASITVYNVSGHSAIDFINNGTAFFIADSAILNDEEKIRFHIKPNRLLAGVNDVYDNERGFKRDVDGASLMLWNDVKIIHINSRDFGMDLNLEPDLVVISNNGVSDLSSLNLKKNTKLIFDGSNSYYYTRRMLAQAKEMDVTAHAVQSEGAFNLKLESKL